MSWGEGKGLEDLGGAMEPLVGPEQSTGKGQTNPGEPGSSARAAS